MSVQVIGRRLRIEPPELGNCEDPECLTVSAQSIAYWGDDRSLLLVAMYSVGDRRENRWQRVCAPCDERRLRAWLEGES